MDRPQKISFAKKRATAILIKRLPRLCRGPTQGSLESYRLAEWSHSGLAERYPGLAEQ
jgi:hypothetical protein